jgi:CheY-like chemotaxis protein
MSARVLVVDDNEANRKLLHAKLTNEYFHVITAVDGVDAIERAIAEEPDVILMAAGRLPACPGRPIRERPAKRRASQP